MAFVLEKNDCFQSFKIVELVITFYICFVINIKCVINNLSHFIFLCSYYMIILEVTFFPLFFHNFFL